MGRKKGSKNKVKIQQKTEQAIPLDIKDVRRQLRMLRKIKKDTRKGSEERHELCKKIRDLKKQLIPILTKDPEKEVIINAILLCRPEYSRLDMNLNKHSLEALKKHLQYIQGRSRLI